MQPIYLSPDRPRWAPKTEQDLRLAVEEGLLTESHYFEAKRELEPGKTKNREHARDLASLAVDGGTLIAGLDENKTNGTFVLAPQPLDGLRERVEAIARTIPDQPLDVITEAIPSAADPSTGYLVIHVPPSPVAPHMVDGRYLGRGDSGKRTLSDAEVVRLHERRRSAELDAAALLDVEFARDPVPPEARKQAHLFLLAEPVAGRPDLLVPVLNDPRWNTRLHELIRDGACSPEVETLLGPSPFAPDMLSASTGAPRSNGAARACHLTSDRAVRVDDSRSWEDVVEVEFHENGGLRVFMGRLSDNPGTGGQDIIFDTAVVVYVHRLLGLVRAVADCVGYLGNWSLAVGATGLKGKAAYRPARWSSSSPYEADVYRQATIASRAELLRSPGPVLDRLAGRLLRGLGVRESWQKQLSAPALPEDADLG